MLQRHAEPALLVAQAQSAASGQTAQVYADTRYRARTWDRDPPRRDQGRGRPARRPRAARQPALRRDQSAPDAALPPMNGSTAPAATSRTASRNCSMACRSTARAAVASGQSTARAPHRRRLRADARTPGCARRRTACARAQVTWLRDRLLKLGAHVVGLGPPRGPAPADRHTGPPRLAAHRAGTRRPPRIDPRQRPSGRAYTAAQRRTEPAHGEAVPGRPHTQAFRTGNQCPSRQRPTAATPGAPRCATITHRPRGRLGAFTNNAG